MPKKILIVEDEIIIADDLKFMLRNDGYEVLEPCDNAADALRIIASVDLDLLLLDINIKGSTNGIELAAKVESDSSLPFIFITSYYDDDTLKKVEQVSPMAYIIKPFKQEEVLMNVRLAMKKSRGQALRSKKTKIFVRESGILKPVKGESILIAEAESNYTRLRMLDGREYLISHTLKSIEEKLPADIFCRVHKSYIINFDFIELIERNSVQIAKMSIPIGKSYREGFFKYLEVL